LTLPVRVRDTTSVRFQAEREGIFRRLKVRSCHLGMALVLSMSHPRSEVRFLLWVDVSVLL
jgi:hypothetical protein